MAEKLMFRPTEAADAIGIGRSRIYELIASGTIPSIKVGKSVRVPVAALNDWIAQQLAENTASAA